MPAFVEFDHVYKRYKMGEVTITANDDVSFAVNKGEFAVIVGSSGAGKSTVLNILGGMDPVSYTHLDVYKRQPICIPLK